MKAHQNKSMKYEYWNHVRNKEINEKSTFEKRKVHSNNN